MSIDLKVYNNGDHTALIWFPKNGKPIKDCRGFGIRRVLNGTESYLHNFVGFSETQVPDPANPWKFPIQRYMWWDYKVIQGDVVQYSIVPVVGPDQTKLQLSPADASPLSDKITVSSSMSPNMNVYFNKGIVSAQWVSRALDKLGNNPKLKDVISDPKNELRVALSGMLRPALLDKLAEVKKNGGQIYGSLYELNDPELLGALTALGKNCHLILANGAFKTNTPPDNDENMAIRKTLKNQVDLYDRLVQLGHFAHNKIIIFCDSKGTPQSVLTGSTNWTITGLCTQANNGLIINDANLAAYYFSEWQQIKAAGSGYPASFATFNSTPKTLTIDGAKVTQWFVPTTAAQDLEYARTLIRNAKDGILFLFFNPGVYADGIKPKVQWTLLQDIIDRHDQKSANYDPALYIQGVVNQEINGLTSPYDPAKAVAKKSGKAAPPVSLIGGSAPGNLSPESMVPKNIKDKFFNWEKEIMNVGVHIHSKVIIVDPFGDHPVVMTGSHNLGFKASSKNDDNLCIIEGNGALAAAYAINIIATYQNYRWNANVEANRNNPKFWHGLEDDDTWQNSYLTGKDLAELNFWMHGLSGVTNIPNPTPANTVPAPPAVLPSPSKAPAKSPARTPPKKVVKKVTKKVAKKATKKVAKKAPKKVASKKVAPKKVIKKATKKVASKATKKVAKKAPKKVAPKKVAPKKVVKKATKKVVRKATKKVAKKAPKKVATKKVAPKKAVKKTAKKATPKKVGKK